MLFKKKAAKEHVYSVRGTDYHMDAISMLAIKNPLYPYNKAILEAVGPMQRVYEYLYIERPVQLVPEKNNKHDKNAVMVMIAGQHVGYIPAESAADVRKDIKRGLSNLNATVYGGRYKTVSALAEAEPWDDSIHIKVRYMA